MQRPPADVARLPVRAVKLDEEFVEAATTGGRVARTPDILTIDLVILATNAHAATDSRAKVARPWGLRMRLIRESLEMPD